MAMARQSCVIFALVGFGVLTGCATTDSIDPRTDQGLITTIRGVSGGYENFAGDQLDSLAAEGEEARRLREEAAALSADMADREAQAARIRASIADMQADMAVLATQLAGARASNASEERTLAQLRERLDALVMETSRLDTTGLNTVEALTALQVERDRLAAEVEELEQISVGLMY